MVVEVEENLISDVISDPGAVSRVFRAERRRFRAPFVSNVELQVWERNGMIVG